MNDYVNFQICQKQGEIYEKAATLGYDMQNFSNLFLASNFCNKHFDDIWSIYHASTVNECMYEIKKELNKKLTKYTNSMIMNPEICWWIGYTYRQIAIETGQGSLEILKKIPFITMYQVYPGYHTLDENDATDMLCENHGLIKIIKETA